MDLKNLLAVLRQGLKDRGIFSEEPEPSAADVRLVSLNHLDSAYPLDLFVDWLARMPEAQDLLRPLGIGWGYSPGNGPEARQVISQETLTLPSGPCCFRVAVGDPPRYLNCELVDVSGPLLKVRLEGKPLGVVSVIKIEQVSPVDRARVEQVIASLPGSKERLVWEGDELVDEQPEIQQDGESDAR